MINLSGLALRNRAHRGHMLRCMNIQKFALRLKRFTFLADRVLKKDGIGTNLILKTVKKA